MPIKPTDELLTKFQNRVAYLNRAINAMKKVTDADSVDEFWEAMATVLEAKKNAAELQLNRFMDLTDKQIISNLQQVQDFKFFLSMPEDFKKDIPAMERDLKKAVADEAGYRANSQRVEREVRCNGCGKLQFILTVDMYIPDWLLTRTRQLGIMVLEKSSGDALLSSTGIEVKFGLDMKCVRCKEPDQQLLVV